MYFMLLVLCLSACRIFHYELGYLFFIAIQMSRLPKFTGITAILQPSTARFMLCLQHSDLANENDIKKIKILLNNS